MTLEETRRAVDKFKNKIDDGENVFLLVVARDYCVFGELNTGIENQGKLLDMIACVEALLKKAKQHLKP